MSIKSGTIIISSNKPNSISGMFFYRADTYPNIQTIYNKNNNIQTGTDTNSLVENHFLISVNSDGTILVKSKLPSDIFITISFLEKKKMYN